MGDRIMKERIKELATTIPGLFFITLACVGYGLSQFGIGNLSFWHMLLPLCLGIFLVISSKAKISKFVSAIISKFTGKIGVFLILVVGMVISSCSLESRMIKSDDTCILCDQMCDVRDSIYIEKTKEVIRYDTIVKLQFDDSWFTASASITDTVYINNEQASAYSYIDGDVLRVALRSNKELEKSLTLYKEKVTEKTERFEKSQALNNKLKNDNSELQNSLEKSQKKLVNSLRIRNILIILTSLLIALCWYLIKRK